MPVSIDLRHLACFLSAVECGSISHGALIHNVSQPTFSTRIRQLESAMNVRLFHRNGRGVVATAAARLLYDRIKPLIASLDTALIEAAAVDGRDQGEVVVGIVPTAAGRLSIPLAGGDDAAHLRIRVVESFSGHLQDWLLQGDIDIAVCSAMPRQKRIRQTLIRGEALQLVGRRKGSVAQDTVSFCSLQGVPLVLGSTAHSIRQILDTVSARQRVQLQVAYEIDGLDAQLRFVRQGLGYAILPAGTLDGTADAGSLQTWTIVDPPLLRQLVVATLPQTEALKPAVGHVAALVMRMLRGGG